MKKLITLCLVIGLMMGLCACGGRPPQDSDVGVVSTTTTTATQGGASSVDATTGASSADTAGSSAATTTVAGDTIAPVGTTTVSVGNTTTLTDSPTTTVPSSVGNPSVTTTTAAATATTTTTTTMATTTATKPPLQQGDLAGKSLSVGDRMYDFTVTDSDGNTLTLSRMLQDKEMVVLNFWYINCKFCVKEFPAMSEAYGAYKDRVGMVALNPYDTEAGIDQFRVDNASLTFPMAQCPSSWVQTFALRGFPTTVVIDREGIIRKMHVGALQKTSDWEALFEPYLAD